MRRFHAKLAFATILAGLPLFAKSQPVILNGGWVAEFSPAVPDAPDRSTTVFRFEGSYKMTLSGAEEVYFLTTCVGMEASTKSKSGDTVTKGNGRCKLKDKQGDTILASMETAFDGFTLRIDGGTGRWSGAKGTIISKETFTVESDEQLKGFSNAKGNVDLAVK